MGEPFAGQSLTDVAQSESAIAIEVGLPTVLPAMLLPSQSNVRAAQDGIVRSYATKTDPSKSPTAWAAFESLRSDFINELQAYTHTTQTRKQQDVLKFREDLAVILWSFYAFWAFFVVNCQNFTFLEFFSLYEHLPRADYSNRSAQ